MDAIEASVQPTSFLFQAGAVKHRWKVRKMLASHETEIPPRRVIRRSNEWTLREHAVVVEYWPDVPQIRKLLPHRSEHAIRSFATKCNLRKPIHQWTAAQDAVLRRRVRQGVPRQEIASELRLTVLQVSNRMRYTGLTGGRRRPQEIPHPLMGPIRQRLFDLNMTAADLDEECRSGKCFQKWAPSRKIHIKHIIKALKVLDGQLTIQWAPLDQDPEEPRESNVVALRPH